MLRNVKKCSNVQKCTKMYKKVKIISKVKRSNKSKIHNVKIPANTYSKLFADVGANAQNDHQIVSFE